MASSKLSFEFSDMEFVGEGAYGKVYRGKEKSSGKVCALKILKVSTSAHQKEIDALKQLPEHTNIVKYIRSVITEDNVLCLVMEYCSGGTLNDYLVSHRQPEPSRDLRFMREIASAVAFLHRHGVVHRDLKPDNILLSANGTLKVADFGLAKIITDSKCSNLLSYYMGTECGTSYFMAPEVRSGHYTLKSDIFSVGVIFACILQGTVVPTSDGRRVVVVLLHNMSIEEALGQDKSTRFLFQKDLNISQATRTLVEQMLERTPSCRPTAAEVKTKLGA